jgi:DNA-binding NtrC family response regulator
MISNQTTQFYSSTKPAQALQVIKNTPIDIVLLDIDIPRENTLTTLQNITSQSPGIPVIMYTGRNEVPLAVEYIKNGAYGYVIKGHDAIDELSKQISSAYQKKAYQASMISKKGYMKSIYEIADKVASEKTIPILILGETGVGKEYLARYIHEKAFAGKSNTPFISVNCGAIPETLIDSELFGHERGAFTDAIGQKIGKFELANGGTLFLDEIGTMPVQVQVRLLRVLEERIIERIGGNEPIPINIRLIAATNDILTKLIKNGEFRADLYYRLSGAELEIPPLRERAEEIPQWIHYFLVQNNAEYKTLSPPIMELLKQYPWPGNLRELKYFINLLCCVSGKEDKINLDHFPKNWLTRVMGPYKKQSIVLRKQMIKLLYEAFEKNLSKVALFLGVNRSTLYRNCPDIAKW